MGFVVAEVVDVRALEGGVTLKLGRLEPEAQLEPVWPLLRSACEGVPVPERELGIGHGDDAGGEAETLGAGERDSTKS